MFILSYNCYMETKYYKNYIEATDELLRIVKNVEENPDEANEPCRDFFFTWHKNKNNPKIGGD